MSPVIKNLLITGLPGVGKTTLIKKLGEKIKYPGRIGFYTEEIRNEGIRQGFSLLDFDGGNSILSHVNINSSFRVGKYGVDIDRFENFIDTIDFFNPENQIIIIDEIGKMECLSEKFCQLLSRILDSDKQVVASIALKGTGFIEKLKRRNDIRLITINPANRVILIDEILGYLFPSKPTGDKTA